MTSVLSEDEEGGLGGCDIDPDAEHKVYDFAVRSRKELTSKGIRAAIERFQEEEGKGTCNVELVLLRDATTGDELAWILEHYEEALSPARLTLKDNEVIIIKVPDEPHARACEVGHQVGTYCDGPLASLYLVPYANGSNGRDDMEGNQPDVCVGAARAYFPEVRRSIRGSGFTRAVWDVEVGNRGSLACRRYGFSLFASGPMLRSFICLKFYFTRESPSDDNPGYNILRHASAIAIRWEKDMMGSIEFQDAVDFGIDAVPKSAIRAWTKFRAGNVLAHIPATSVINRSVPPAPASISTPEACIWYEIRASDNGAVVNPPPGAAGDLTLDLRKIWARTVAGFQYRMNGVPHYL